jgi:hypothetical protein
MCPIVSRIVCLFVILALLTVATPLPAEPNARGIELRHRLDEIVKFEGIDDSRATLTDALDQISKRYNLTFYVNEDAFTQAGLKDSAGKVEIAHTLSIPPMQTKLGTVLHRVLKRVPHSATFFIRGDEIEITTTEAIRKEFFADRPTMPGPLPPLVSGEFDKTTTLETALKQLNRYGNVVLDARANKQSQATVTADLANVPLDTAVRMFADMAGLKVVQLDNSLYVTSKENAKVLLKEQEKQKRERERQDKKKAKKEEENRHQSLPRGRKYRDEHRRF